MSVFSTAARLSARAAAMPANPPPMIKTRFFRMAVFAESGLSSGNDLVRTVVIGVTPGFLKSVGAVIRYWIQPRTGPFLNGVAMHRTPVPRSSRWGQEVLEQHAWQNQPEGHG